MSEHDNNKTAATATATAGDDSQEDPSVDHEEEQQEEEEEEQEETSPAVVTNEKQQHSTSTTNSNTTTNNKSNKKKRALSEDDEDQSPPPQQHNKKSHTDHDYDHQENGKKAKIDNTATTTTSSSSEVVPTSTGISGKVLSMTGTAMIMEVAPDKVAQIIGSKGMIIQEIQSRTGVKAYVNQDFPPGVNRQLHLTGTTHQIDTAADLVRRILVDGPTAIHHNSIHGGPQVTRVIECTQSQVGKIIGTGGATIKEIQSKSGAKIQIDQDYPPEVPRKIHIAGSATAVDSAAQLINNLMSSLRGRQGPPPALTTPYGAPPMGAYGPPPTAMSAMNLSGEVTQMMDVPKSSVGKILGKGGDTIQLIQRRSGCRVTVDQNVPDGMPCKVSILGTQHNSGLAASLIQEIVAGVHTSKIGMNLPPPVLPGATQQMPPAAAASNPYAMGAPPGYGMPYPMPGYGYPPAAYGAQPYGVPPAGPPGAPPAAYGAYNPYSMPMPMAAPPQSQQGAPQRGGQPAGGYGVPSASYQAYAPAAAPAPAPGAARPAPTPSSVWTEHKTDDGLTYWYNASTGVSQWERPKNF
eukprot:gene5603-6169_t